MQPNQVNMARPLPFSPQTPTDLDTDNAAIIFTQEARSVCLFVFTPRRILMSQNLIIEPVSEWFPNGAFVMDRPLSGIYFLDNPPSTDIFKRYKSACNTPRTEV